MYDVVLLVQQELSQPDTQRVAELHEELPDRVCYHLIIPCEDAAASVEASVATLAGTDLYAAATARYSAETPAQQAKLAEAEREARRAIEARAKASLDRSVKRLQALGRPADGVITWRQPVDELVDQVKRIDAQEVIVLTRPHVVAEFFHVDWSAQARRHLGVPVLHLLEQYQDNPLEPGQ